MARFWSGREGKDLSSGSSCGLIIGSLGRTADPSPQQKNAVVSIWGFRLYNTWQRTSAISTSFGWRSFFPQSALDVWCSARSTCASTTEGGKVNVCVCWCPTRDFSDIFFFLCWLWKKAARHPLSLSLSICQWEESRESCLWQVSPQFPCWNSRGKEQTSLPETDYACNISRITMQPRHSWNVSPSLDIPELSAITSVRRRFSFLFLFFYRTKTWTHCRIPALFLSHTRWGCLAPANASSDRQTGPQLQLEMRNLELGCHVPDDSFLAPLSSPG